MKPGTIYRLGQHRLVCGDSSDSELIAKLVGETKIDLIICDPPYGVNYTESKLGIANIVNKKAIANDDIVEAEGYEQFTKAWLETIKPYLALKNSLYIFNSDKMLLSSVKALEDTGGKFTQLLVWAKTQAVVGRMDYLPQHELIIYGWYGTHRFAKSKDKSVLIYPKPNASKLHPTMKPVGLLRRLILNSSKIGDIVFDGFGGSGSTLIACEQTHRKCLMAELDPDYCQVIIDRWQKLTGETVEELS
ncbi:MAG: DNA-methyltransferase [Candidatus Saccharimonadales bacterium]